MLKPIYEKLEDIDSKYRDLYKEVDGKYVFDGVDGISQTNIDRLEGALRKEREISKQFKTERDDVQNKLKNWEALAVDVDEAKTRIDAYTGNKDNQEAFETALNERMELERKRHEIEMTALNTQVESLKKDNSEKAVLVKTHTINGSLDIAMEKAGIRPEARDVVRQLGKNMFDVDDQGNVLATMDFNGAKSGMNPEQCLEQWRTTSAYMFGTTTGAGSIGGNSSTQVKDPFKTGDITGQVEYAKKYGTEAAKQKLAEAKAEAERPTNQ